MGGSVFSAGPDPLFTPRMPTEIYLAVKDRCNAILRELFHCVASPIEGPAKKDYGDLDILVTWPKGELYEFAGSANPNVHQSMAVIEKHLGAARTIINKDASSHMALPWPNEPELNIPGPGDEDETEPQSPPRFVQVDIRICDSLDQFQWILFKHAHGDMWNLLGALVRPLGLTIDEVGLYVRVPEIERFERRRSRVLLTSEPARILAFLGLEEADYWDRPFASLDDMFEYTARCRMFWVRPADENEHETGGGGPPGDGTADGAAGGNQGVDADRRRLKSNDRRRMNGRPGFRRYIEEFLPRCRAEGRAAVPPLTREEVTEEALERFAVRERYARQRSEFLRERQRETVVKDIIKPCMPEEPDGEVSEAQRNMHRQRRGCLIKELKKIILEEEYALGVEPEEPLRDGDGLFIMENVAEFVKARKDDVAELAMHGSFVAYAAAKEKRGQEKKPEHKPNKDT